MTTAAVVLAAGEGARFGGPEHKLLAAFRGKPLVAWALAAAADAALDELIVVTGAIDLADLVPEGAEVVRNRCWDSGMATSLRAGWRAAEDRGHDAIVLGLGDAPLVPASAWRAVAASTAPIATATFEGYRHPPVRLHRSVWPLLPADGDHGARALMHRRPDLVAEVACEGQAVDIDRREDLERWS